MKSFMLLLMVFFCSSSLYSSEAGSQNKTETKQQVKAQEKKPNIENNTPKKSPKNSKISNSDKAEKTKVMFFELKAISGFNSGQAKLLENVILAELSEYNKFSVVSKSDVEKILNAEEFKQLLDCQDNSCLLEISGALGTEILVSGDIGILGTVKQLSLQIINNRDGTVYSRVSKTIEAEGKALIEQTKLAVRHLLKKYDPSYNLILSLPEKSQTVEPTLKVLNQPKQGSEITESKGLLSKWWFWTGLGILVAGGTVLALGSKDEDSKGSGDSSKGSGSSSKGLVDLNGLEVGKK